MSNDGGDEFLNNVWKLLTKLPKNTALNEQIESCKGPWAELLDGSCHYKLLYSLEILENLTFRDYNPDTQVQDIKTLNFRDTQWSTQFIQSQGYKHLLNILQHSSIQVLKTNLNVRCLNSLMKILVFYLL